MTARPRSVSPTTDGWFGHRFPLTVKLSMIMLPLLIVGLAAGAASAFLTGELGPGAFLAAVAILVAHVVGLGWCGTRITRHANRPPTITSTPDGDGVRFAYSLWPYYWLTVVLVLTGLLLLGWAFLAAASATVAAMVAFAISGVIGWFLLTVLRLAPGKVVVSPAGVLHCALSFTHFVPWDAVVGVSAEWFKVPVIVVRALPSNAARVRGYMGPLHTGEHTFMPSMVIRTSWLATDPTIVYRVLAFYHTRPELRPELATAAALRRITCGRLVPA